MQKPLGTAQTSLPSGYRYLYHSKTIMFYEVRGTMTPRSLHHRSLKHSVDHSPKRHFASQIGKTIDVIKAVVGKLELQMNTLKSKLINLWEDKVGFDFLGMNHRKIPKQIKGQDRYILRSYPSKKAMKKMKEKVKEVTEARNRLFWTMNQMVKELNPNIQEWRNFYAMDSFPDQFLNKIDWYIRKRLTLFCNKKRKKHSKSRLAGWIAQQACWT
ncbi:MAG: group II intron maturase-specific domain-containing protein [Bacillota bacterium]